MRFSLFLTFFLQPVWAAGAPNFQLAQNVFDTHAMGGAVETPIPGVFQFSQGSEVFYISADGRYLMQGEMIDLKNQQNITESFRASERLKLISQLDKRHMIRFAPQKVRYKVKIFIDVNCPYCRLIHNKINDYLQRGIAIEYLAFPRGGLNSIDGKMLQKVFCATDPATKLVAAEQDKLIHEIEENVNCPYVKQQYAVGLAMGVVGTPALLLEDGTLIPGFVSPENLEIILQKHLQK